MKNKEIIINAIQDAHNSNQKWVEQAQLLVRGKATHLAHKPTFYQESEFGLWFYSQGKILSTFSWYAEIETIHKSLHDAYQVIYDNAEQVYDIDSHKTLQNNFSKLERQFDFLVEKLKNAEISLQESSEEVFEDYGLVVKDSHIDTTDIIGDDNESDTSNVKPNIEIIKEEKQEFSKPSYQEAILDPIKVATNSTDIFKQLKQQDLHQLHLEQKLTEQELNQLEERQLLTTQGVMQITQYQELKKQEIDQQLEDHQVLETKNTDAKELGYKELSKLRNEILQKQDELEQLALVDQKLESRVLEEKEKEQKVLGDFAEQQSANKQDLIQLEQQRKQWEKEVRNLKEQLSLIEQDLDNLTKQQQAKQQTMDASNRHKSHKLNELKQYSEEQEILNGHKAKVKETKQEELNKLEEEKLSVKTELDGLDADSDILKNKKIEISSQHKQELKQLDEQQRFKKLTLGKLEQDRRRKNQELKELAHQQAAIQQSLDQLDQSEKATSKDLETV
jgi:hypothetical protein